MTSVNGNISTINNNLTKNEWINLGDIKIGLVFESKYKEFRFFGSYLKMRFSASYKYEEIGTSNSDSDVSFSIGSYYYSGGNGSMWINIQNCKVINWISVRNGAVNDIDGKITIYGKLK